MKKRLPVTIDVTSLLLILCFGVALIFVATVVNVFLTSVNNYNEATEFCQQYDLKLTSRENEEMATCIGFVGDQAKKYEIIKLDEKWYFEGGWKQ